MNKKFVDINNLQIVWDEINDKFARMTDLEARTANLSVSYFNPKKYTSPEFTLECPEPSTSNKHSISKVAYDDFIKFANSDNYKKFVYDIEDRPWMVVSQILYNTYIKETGDKSHRFNGVVVMSNTIGDSESVDSNMYTIYVNKDNISGTVDDIYTIYWEPYDKQYCKLKNLSDSINKVYGDIDAAIVTINQNISELDTSVNNINETVKNINESQNNLIKDVEKSIENINNVINITFNNLLSKINKLEDRVKYLEEHGGGSDTPDLPDTPSAYSVELAFYDTEGNPINDIAIDTTEEEITEEIDRATIYKDY